MKSKLLIGGVLIIVVVAGLLFRKSAPEPSNALSGQEMREQYLTGHLLTPAFGGKVVCSYRMLGGQDNETAAREFVWAFCEEYYFKDDVFTTGSGVSMPVVLTVAKGRVTGHQAPRNGSLYAADIHQLFPEDIRTKFPDIQASISQLSLENRSKAEAAYSE